MNQKPKTVEDAASAVYGWLYKDEKAMDALITDELVFLYFTINNELLSGNDELLRDCARYDPNLQNLDGPINENAAGLIKRVIRERVIKNMPHKRIQSAYVRQFVEHLREAKGRISYSHLRRSFGRLDALGHLSKIEACLQEKTVEVLMNWIWSWPEQQWNSDDKISIVLKSDYGRRNPRKQ